MTKWRVGEQTPEMSIFNSKTIAWCETPEEAWTVATYHARNRIMADGWRVFDNNRNDCRILLFRQMPSTNEYNTIAIEEVYGV